MKKILFSAIIMTVARLCLAESPPDSNPEKSPSAEPPRKIVIVPKKSETHKFGGLSLKGQLKKPELGYIYKRRGLRQEQIVNIPENFNGEIISGVGQF